MSFRKIEIEPVSGNLGAIIHGVDLGKLDDETFEEVHQAWLDNGVVFFRDQDITPDEQIAFAKRFGEIHFHPYMRGLDEHPEVLEIVALRAGSHPGMHTVGFDGPGESLQVKVEARDRSAYVAGALLSADALIEAPDRTGVTAFTDLVRERTA